MFSMIKSAEKRDYAAMKGLDVYTDIFDTNISSKLFRREIDDAMKRYMPISSKNPSLQYAVLGEKLLSSKIFSRSIIRLPETLIIPAFGMDPVDETQAKFDLVASTLTPLYSATSPSIRPNTLLFHFTGICPQPFAEGESCPSLDSLKRCSLVSSQSRIGGEKERNLLQQVDESFSFGMTHNAFDPLATIVPYNLLQGHITAANDILRSQYASTMRHKDLNELREAVIDQHGSDSIASLMVYMDSPTKMFATFIPRGICSSISTGKTVEYSEKASYKGVVTIQTTGTLNVDVEDGDCHLPIGSQMNVANLYLIFEMRELVPNDCKFNYPSIHLKLTSQSIDELEEEKMRETGGRCYLSRNGDLTKTIIQKIATLRVGPYRVHGSSFVDCKQMHQFDITMELQSSRPRYITFQRSFQQ
jgi:hypothetical protein